MSDHPKVAIFWDYENCSPPSNSCGLGYGIVNNIGRIARLFGIVTTFRAYLDISGQSSKSVVLRSELQSSGVSMIDCPHNGKKDVVDKMMLVDMLAFAVDHPAPATIILITGDRDYAYAASILKLRKYQVILVVPSPPHTSPSLESQASLVIDWSSAILRSRTEPLNSAQLVRHPYSDLDATLVSKLLRELQESSPDGSDATLHSYSTPSRGPSRLRRVTTRDLLEPSTFDFPQEFTHNPLSPRKATSTGCDPVPPIPKTPSRSRHASISTGSTRAHSTTTTAQCPPQAEQYIPAKNPPGSAARRSSAFDATDVPNPAKRSLSISTSLDVLEFSLHDDRPPSSIIIRSPLEPSQPIRDTPGVLGKPNSSPLKSDTLASRFIMTVPLTGSQLDLNQQQQSYTTIKPTSPTVTLTRTTAEAVTALRDTPQPNDVETLDETDDLTDPNIENDEGVVKHIPRRVLPEDACDLLDLTNSNDYACIASQSMHSPSGGDVGLHLADTPALKHVSLTAADFLGVNDRTNTSQLPVCPCAPSQDYAAPSSPPISSASSSNLSTAEPHIHDETERYQTWMMFKPLIYLLLAARARGVVRSSRSIVAIDLVKTDKQVYQRAGVSKFKDYSALAEKAGIVELGGREADAWIGLHPDWFEVDGITATQSFSDDASGSPTFDLAKTTRDLLLTSPESPMIERVAIPQAREPRSPSLEGSNICLTLPASQESSACQGPVLVRFQALINTLVCMRADGTHQPRRSLVGQLLNQEVYVQAGVSGFKEYILKASEARVVEFGGTGGYAWIQLHPELLKLLGLDSNFTYE